MFGSLLGCTLDMDNLKLGSCKQLTVNVSGTVVMHYNAFNKKKGETNDDESLRKPGIEPLTPSTVKRRVMKKRRGRWPIQHLVAMRKNCSWAI